MPPAGVAVAPGPADAWSTPPVPPPGPRRSLVRRLLPGTAGVVAALVLVLGLAPERPGGLGPDHSDLVRRAAAGELPPPLQTTAQRPTRGFEEQPSPLGAVPPAPADHAYTFQRMQTTTLDGQIPVSWSPCRPVHVVVDPTDAPERFVDDVVASMGALSAATGLQLVLDGTVSEPADRNRPAFLPDRYGDRWAPVLVRFSDADVVPELDEAVGLAVMWDARDVLTGQAHGVSGWVYLDRELLGRSTWGVPDYVPVLRHELAHVVGLDHVDDPSQIMNPHVTAVRTYADGDLAGLARLGSGACAPGL